MWFQNPFRPFGELEVEMDSETTYLLMCPSSGDMWFQNPFRPPTLLKVPAGVARNDSPVSRAGPAPTQVETARCRQAESW